MTCRIIESYFSSYSYCPPPPPPHSKTRWIGGNIQKELEGQTLHTENKKGGDYSADLAFCAKTILTLHRWTWCNLRTFTLHMLSALEQLRVVNAFTGTKN